MRPSLLNPFFAGGNDAHRRRFPARQAIRACSAATRRRASSTCCSICRPARSTAGRGRNCATSCRHGGHCPGPPWKATARPAQPAARALPDLDQRRHRRPDPAPSSNAQRIISRSFCRSASTATCPGTAALYDGMLQMVHPDRVVDEAEAGEAAAGRAGLSADRGAWRSTQVRKAVDGALAKRTGRCPNGRIHAWLARERLSGLRGGVAASCIARPNPPDVLPERHRRGRGSPMTNSSPGNSRLALVRTHLRRAGRARSAGDRRICASESIAAAALLADGSQQRAVGEIVADLAKPERMLRLLQGDVGSGKTVVALARRRGRDRGRHARPP